MFYDTHLKSVKHTGLVSFDRWMYPFVSSVGTNVTQKTIMASDGNE